MSKLFSPDTLTDEVKASMKYAIERTGLSDEAKEAVIGARLNYPDTYCDLAELAHIGRKSGNLRAFYLGVRIFMDMKGRNRRG